MSPDAEIDDPARISGTATSRTRRGGGARVSPAVLAAGLLWGLGILIPNIMPVLFQALQRSRGLTESQLGGVGAAFVLGAGLASGTGPFWAPRANVRWVSFASLALAAGALLSVALLKSATAMDLGWFVIGAATSGFGTPAFAALGNTDNPVCTYSLALFASSVLAAVLSFALPLVVLPRFGGGGVILALAAVFALAIPGALALARHPRSASVPVSRPAGLAGRTWKAAVAPILACLAGAVFTGVLMGAVYNFVGAFAAAAGIGAGVVGVFVGAALLSSLVGSLAPSFLGTRVGPAGMIGLSTMVMLLTYPGLLSHSAATFGVCFSVNMAFSTFGYTYFLALVRQLDATNRIYIAYPAAMSLGTSAMTAGAGAVLSLAPPWLLLAGAAGFVAASLLTALVACRFADAANA